MEQRVGGNGFFSRSLSALHYAQRVAGGHLIVMHSTRCGRHEDCPNCLERLRFLALSTNRTRSRWTMW